MKWKCLIAFALLLQAGITLLLFISLSERRAEEESMLGFQVGIAARTSNTSYVEIAVRTSRPPYPLKQAEKWLHCICNALVITTGKEII